MEDKELQQLFDAKRTQLANQRRQEAIASRLGRRRAAWPWWAGAAAAAMVLGLILAPALFGEEPEEGTLMAEWQGREIIEEIEAIDRIETIEAIEKGIERKKEPRKPKEEEPKGTPQEPQPAMQEEPIEEPAAEAPRQRIHRRRSDRMAIVSMPAERPKAPKFIAHYLDLPDSVNIAKNIIAKF